jgi:chromosome segregation ATPase
LASSFIKRDDSNMKTYEEEISFYSAVSTRSLADLCEHKDNCFSMQPMLLVPANEFCAMKVKELQNDLHDSRREIQFLKEELQQRSTRKDLCDTSSELVLQNKKYAEAVEHLAQELVDLQTRTPDKSAVVEENSKLKQENMLIRADLKASQELISELTADNKRLKEDHTQLATQLETLKQRVVDFFFKA